MNNDEKREGFMRQCFEDEMIIRKDVMEKEFGFANRLQMEQLKAISNARYLYDATEKERSEYFENERVGKPLKKEVGLVASVIIWAIGSFAIWYGMNLAVYFIGKL